MAFVITGNAWAESITVKTIVLPSKEGNAYIQKSDFSSVDWTKAAIGYDGAFYPKVKDYNNEQEKVIVATGVNGFAYEKNMFLYGGFTRNISGEIQYRYLNIRNNVVIDGFLEMAGGYVANQNEQKAKYNVLGIGYEIKCKEGDIVANDIADDISLDVGGVLYMYGGYSNGASNNYDADVSYNTVRIINTTITNDGALDINGGNNKSKIGDGGYCQFNRVELENVSFSVKNCLVDDTIHRMIIGGNSHYVDVNNNEVVIKDSNVSNIDVCGGRSLYGGDVCNNSVTLQDVIIGNSNIYGGYSPEGGIVSGNTLNIGGEISGVVNEIGGFATINYDDLKWNTKVPVLKTTNLVLDSNEKIAANVNGLANGSTPKKGEVMTLLDTNNKDLPDNYLFESESTFNSGDFLQAEGKIYQDAEDIKLKITRVGTNDQALVIGESRAAATAFANQGSELVEIGLDSLARDKSDKETKVFASVYGNTSEYATGSHVKVNGWSGIVGVAKTNDDGLTTGAFFENGEGNYRTFNNFEGFLMRGDGEANYNGGGFFARKDNANGVYTEASLRAGNLQNELRKAVITDSKLEGYDIDTFYYGAHVGVGRIIPRGNEGDSIDVYVKFIYTHHDSEDFAIGGDDFHFDSIDSERLRLGFRINEVQNDKLSMYYGAAWEYEFNGDANNTVIGCDISTPSLGGSTVIGEIGAHYKANEKWTFNANLRGYAGQRDGFTGSVQANYAF